LIEFDWTGTYDPSAWLCVPESIRSVGALDPKGWPAIMQRNHELAVNARQLLCRTLYIPPPCPDDMIGSMASLPLPAGAPDPSPSPLYIDPLQEMLLRKHRIEVPIIPWPAPPERMLRISAQVYNRMEQYQLLAQAVAEFLERV
jgi:isopenicillin-N epimerase